MTYILIIIVAFGSGVSPGFAIISEQFYTGEACDTALKGILSGIGNHDSVKVLSAGCHPKGKL